MHIIPEDGTTLASFAVTIPQTCKKCGRMLELWHRGTLQGRPF